MTMAPRGITQTDVQEAADAILLEGARPTIERVRQQLGRGSPNTVTPLLNAWFAGLHQRIKDPAAFRAPTAAPDVPEPIMQAATRLWDAARAEARSDFDQQLREQLAESMESTLAILEAEKGRAAAADEVAAEAVASARRFEQEIAALTAGTVAERAASATLKSKLDIADGRATELMAQAARLTQQLQQERLEAQRSVTSAESRADLAEERSDGAQRRAALEIESARALRIEAEKRAGALLQRADLFEERLRTDQARVAEERIAMESQRTADLVAARLLASEHANQGTLLRAKEAELQAAKTELQIAYSTVEQMRDALASANLAHAQEKARSDMTDELIASLKLSGQAAKQ